MAELSFGKRAQGEPPDPSHQVETTTTRYQPFAPSDATAAITIETEFAEIAAAQVDPKAFAPIYERYVDLVYRYTFRQQRDPDRAADATGTVFSHALAAIPSFRPRTTANDGSTFRSWLMTIARNVVIDLERRQPVMTPLDDPAIQACLHDRHASPEEQALNAIERIRIDRALAQLPPVQRQIVELRAIGMSGAEIAATLRMTVGAVKTAHFRAYARLRELLMTGDES